MTSIKINEIKTLGRIKPMHAVGQPPLLGIRTELFSYLKEANIPYSRLHDVGGWFGGNLFVNIPNIFRDFDANEYDPASYTFEFTDILISALMENGCEPHFRLGVSIENFFKIKTFRIFPPKDFAKWARICEHIIRHYNEGWANGFHYDIKYWEIWNEPDCIVPDGKETGILIANVGEDTQINLNKSQSATAYIIDKEHMYKKTDINLSCFELKKNQVVYIDG